jgi:hypothetical protein
MHGQIASATFGVNPENLVPEAEGMVDPFYFSTREQPRLITVSMFEQTTIGAAEAGKPLLYLQWWTTWSSRLADGDDKSGGCQFSGATAIFQTGSNSPAILLPRDTPTARRKP